MNETRSPELEQLLNSLERLRLQQQIVNDKLKEARECLRLLNEKLVPKKEVRDER